ncbi:MAG TPA: ring-cleaving dioxygenase [Bryobacteraceae bacterium]|jgi:glyoxalase family protein
MITGIHHVTAIASDPKKNVAFYTQFLGLKLVKKTVNFDDPTTYHLYCGDSTGAPGSILTFFPWPHSFRGRTGAAQATVTAYAVPRDSLDHWIARAKEYNVPVSGPAERFGEEYITLRDPDNMAIELVASAAPALGEDVTPRSLHSVTLTEWNLGPTADFITSLLQFTPVAEHGNRTRYLTGGPGFLDIETVPDQRRGSSGAGIVHHIAFRTPNDETQKAWHEKIASSGHSISPIMDRNYFHSIYFREPGGVLFEIATDPPGFAVDEPASQLGQSLKLPVWYEERRAELEASLPALV